MLFVGYLDISGSCAFDVTSTGPRIRIRLRQRSGLSETNLNAGPGVAIREALLKTGEADYLLFAGVKAIATVEAKPEGYTLTGVEGQSLKYATGLLNNPCWSDPLPFC